MSYRFRSAAIAGAVALAAALAVSAACRSGAPARPDERIDGIFSGLVSAGEPGAAVLVVEGGRAAFERGYGVADLRTRRPIDGRTNFRLASVSKQFTAAAIMLLVGDGRLGYETRLAEIWPDFPANGCAVTVRQLLNHTSGLADYEDLMPRGAPSASGELVQIKDAEVLALLRGAGGLQFEPGTRWKYSNSGYVLLGLIVEKASGLPFGRFLKERIFDPLGMARTLAYEKGTNEVPDRAYGHGRREGEWRETDQSPTSATLGDGGVYSSLEDLARWDDALRRGALLGAEDMREALTPVRAPAGPPEAPDGSPSAYGFGWFLDPWRGHARMWHYGETMGFRTAIHRFPDDGLTVVVLANRSDLDASALALRVANLWLAE